MKHIIVKDYLYDENNILGNFYEEKNGDDYYLLDDGDIYTIKQLKEGGYKIMEITSNDIIEKFKEGFER